MNILFNIRNFLHFGVSLFLTIGITSLAIYVTGYKYRITTYLAISVNVVTLIGISKEIYDYILKSPIFLDTATDLLFDGLGIFVGMVFILNFIKETDR